MLFTIVLALKDENSNERQLGRILSSICKKITDEYQERQAAFPSSCLSLSSLENYGLIIIQRSIIRLENRLAKLENQLAKLEDTMSAIEVRMSNIEVLLQQILTKLNDMEKKTSRGRLSPNGSDDDKYRVDESKKETSNQI
jgi:uncharacterized coiled-coil protein SlyX